jgi:Xaa-Pro aminopeptidase
MTEALLMFGDTDRSADMFHSLPLLLMDPFLLIEVDGRKVAVQSVIERDRILALGDVEVLDMTSLGLEELMRSGLGWVQADLELAVRACERLGITSAVVPPDFWVAIADRLRQAGVDVRVDIELYEHRRRSKTPHQVEGARRAQAAADAAMGEAARLLRELPEGLTAEAVRGAMQAVCRERGCDLDDDVIVAVNEQASSGHEAGFGPIAEGDRVLIDIWPRDLRSRCYADMTRTFVAGGGEPDEELRRYWSLSFEALEAVKKAVRPGIRGRELFDVSCEVFEAAGIPTQRTKEDGAILQEGYYHSLGHGVGLEVHEAPSLGLSGEPLVAGDIIAVEPGAYRQGYGGCRLEDLILVTEDGGEVLTDFPYELTP